MTITIECPECGEFVELDLFYGAYHGKCGYCKKNGSDIIFSVMITSIGDKK